MQHARPKNLKGLVGRPTKDLWHPGCSIPWDRKTLFQHSTLWQEPSLWLQWDRLHRSGYSHTEGVDRVQSPLHGGRWLLPSSGNSQFQGWHGNWQLEAVLVTQCCAARHCLASGWHKLHDRRSVAEPHLRGRNLNNLVGLINWGSFMNSLKE